MDAIGDAGRAGDAPDVPSEAWAVGPGRFSGSLMPSDHDVDWYVFTVPSGHVWALEASGAALTTETGEPVTAHGHPVPSSRLFLPAVSGGREQFVIGVVPLDEPSPPDIAYRLDIQAIDVERGDAGSGRDASPSDGNGVWVGAGTTTGQIGADDEFDHFMLNVTASTFVQVTVVPLFNGDLTILLDGGDDGVFESRASGTGPVVTEITPSEPVMSIRLFYDDQHQSEALVSQGYYVIQIDVVEFANTSRPLADLSIEAWREVEPSAAGLPAWPLPSQYSANRTFELVVRNSGNLSSGEFQIGYAAFPTGSGGQWLTADFTVQGRASPLAPNQTAVYRFTMNYPLDESAEQYDFAVWLNPFGKLADNPVNNRAWVTDSWL